MNTTHPSIAKDLMTRTAWSLAWEYANLLRVYNELRMPRQSDFFLARRLLRQFIADADDRHQLTLQLKHAIGHTIANTLAKRTPL